MLQYVVTNLQAAKGSWPDVAAASDVPLRTLQKIASGEIVNPGIENCQRLYDYFEAQESRSAKRKG